MYILSEYYSDLALNKICFWNFESGIDTFWGLMADHKEPFTDKVSFRVLSKLAKACFVIPVSNADPESIFFNVKKDTNWYE